MRPATCFAWSGGAGAAAPGANTLASSTRVRDPGDRHVRGAVGLVVFLLVAAWLPAQTKEELIYPRGTAPASAAMPVDSRSPGSGVILAVALLAAGGGWWLWLKRRGPAQAGLAAARLAIVESRSLGSRQYLVVADYDGRKFLLGVCPGSIEMLTPLDGEKAKES